MEQRTSDIIAPQTHVSSPSRYIPVELYSVIFEHITNVAFLSGLCKVSRAFRHEAERILYHTIRLPPDYRRISSWSRAIAENPRLGSLVYSLGIPTSHSHSRFLSLEEKKELHTVVKRALSSLSRLEELHIRYFRGPTYLAPDMFLGCPFKLRVFRDGLPYYTLIHWREFLYEQPGIRHWSPYLSQDEDVNLEPDMLPMLTSAHFRLSLLSILSSRPIRALHINEVSSLWFVHELAVGLAEFKHSLTNLSLKIWEDLVDDYAVYIPTVLETLSDFAPNLKFLRLEAAIALFYPGRENESMDFLSALSDLPHLDTLVLEPIPHSPNRPRAPEETQLPSWVNVPKGYDTYQRDWVDSRPKSEAHGSVIATNLMRANRSLRCVVLAAKGAWGSKKLPCYTRARPAEGLGSDAFATAVFQGFDLLGPDAWREI